MRLIHRLFRLAGKRVASFYELDELHDQLDRMAAYRSLAAEAALLLRVHCRCDCDRDDCPVTDWVKRWEQGE